MKYSLFSLALLGLLIPAGSVQAAEKIAFSSNRSGSMDIFSMNPDGTGVINLTATPTIDEDYPWWSPDASKLLYQRTDDIWYMNANGTGKTRIQVGHIPMHAAFRPNSDYISYSRYGGQDHDIYINKLDGLAEQRIINNPLGDYSGRWNPAGTKITFYTFNWSSVPFIYTANPDGTGHFQVTKQGGDRNPSWSPDGGRIVFQSYRSGKEQIYVINADGSGEKRLTDNTANDTVPVFSPDGTKIAFVSDRDGNPEIYVMNSDGSSQTRLTNNTVNDGCPSWQQTLPENAPSVSIDDVTVPTENQYGYFTVQLSAPATHEIKVNPHLYNGTAVKPDDYVAPGLATLTFAPGETSKRIAVFIKDDTLDETNETFFVHLAASGASIADGMGQGTIVDDDGPPTLSIGNITLAEGTGGTSSANFPVTLNVLSGQDVSVQYVTLDNSALAGSDYTAKSGTLVIPAGQTSGTISIQVNPDNYSENSESFYVKLSSATNASLIQSLGRATLSNDDTLPGLFINDTTATEGGSATFTISLSRTIGKTVTVNFATQDATATNGVDYTAKSGTVTIPANQLSTTISIDTLDNQDLNSPRSFYVDLSNLSYGLLADARGTATISNDDFPKITVSDVRQVEGDSDNRTFAFTVAVNAPASFPVSVNFTTEDGSATAGQDYTAASGTVTLYPGETSRAVLLTITPDTESEADETFKLNLSNAVQGTIIKSQGTGTLVNDDAPAGD